MQTRTRLDRLVGWFAGLPATTESETVDLDHFRESDVSRRLLAKLVADAPNMEEDLRIFNAKYRGFITRDDKAMRVVLRCHLIVEHFLDRYLAAANPAVVNWDSARLSFSQKLSLADHPQSSLRLLMPGLVSLNKLRNRIAHRLDAEFDKAAVAPIRDFMRMWCEALGKPVPKGLALLEDFSLQASGWLFGDVCMIERHAPDKGLLGLLEWWRNETNGAV